MHPFTERDITGPASAMVRARVTMLGILIFFSRHRSAARADCGDDLQTAPATGGQCLHFPLGGGGLLASFSASATQPPPMARYKFA